MALMRLARRATNCSCFGGCVRRHTIARYLKRKMPPLMYARSEGQVEEAGGRHVSYEYDPNRVEDVWCYESPGFD